MAIFPSETELNELKAFQRALSLTSYIDFNDLRSNANTSRIEYKNMLRNAESALAEAGAEAKFIQETLEPMRALLETVEFWPPKHESLIIFAHPKIFRLYRVPEGLIKSEMKVQDGFSTEQLEKLMQSNQPYYVLALSRKKTKLYKGDRYGLEPVEIKGIPQEMIAALNIDEFHHSRQFHSITPKSTGAGSKNVHDQSEVDNTDKEMVVEFFRLIDKHIRPILAKDNSPLVIGGVENLVALYNKVNSYPGLVDKFIFGNLDRSSLDTIRAKALAIIQAN